MGRCDITIPGVKPDALQRLTSGPEKDITESDIKSFQKAVKNLNYPTQAQKNLITKIKERIKKAKASTTGKKKK